LNTEPDVCIHRYEIVVPVFFRLFMRNLDIPKPRLLITISVISVPEADSGKYHRLCNKICYSFNDTSPYLYYRNL